MSRKRRRDAQRRAMKIQRAFAVVALGFAAAVAGRAENPFSFSATPGKLPKDVVPRHYAVTLRPDAAALKTEGDVVIELDVLTPARALVFHALDLELSSAAVDGVPVATPKLDAAAQTATISLVTPLAPGKHTLKLAFRGRIGREPVGLYAEKYRVGNVEKQMLGTQMEPTDARRVFPCWDEPVFRATFQLNVTVPAGQVAVSNTPIVTERPLGGGAREVRFAPTPAMASYLFVLCMGELEQLIDEVDGVKLGIWTTAGKREHGRYALEATKRIVRFYNGYFGVKYPLAKLDQIAVPGGFTGAMENWGGITYNESILLFDPATSSQTTKQRIFAVVAHEIAHQWFGNLVTMAWWDNLWLNEGFASWMGTKCTDALNPEWQVWLRDNADKEKVMSRDAQRATHPIQQPVHSESEATDAFDDITYLKGKGFIRMLEAHVGENDFRAGIRAYMAKHAYGSTTTADLWAALEKASGKSLAAMADGWTTRPGFPVVNVSAREANGGVEVLVSQQHFTIGAAAGPTEWKIPITVMALDQKIPAQSMLLEKKTDTLLLRNGAAGGVKLNAGNIGFYRAAYSPALAKLHAARFAMLPEADRVNLLSDAWAMVEAGSGEIALYLDLVAALEPNEMSLGIWEQVIANLSFLRDLAEDTAGAAALERWMKARLRVPFAKLGWEAKVNDSTTSVVLREKLISCLGQLGDTEIVAEARRRFSAFIAKPDSLAADLRSPVMTVIGRHADAATWESLRALARATENSEEKDRYYGAFQGVRDPILAQRTLELALTDDRPFVQWFRIVPSVAQRHPALAWTFAQKNADVLLAKIPDGGAFTTRNTYFTFIAEAFNDAVRAAELEAFVAQKVGPNGQAEAAKTAEKIRSKAAFKRRELPKVEAWMAARP